VPVLAACQRFGVLFDCGNGGVSLDLGREHVLPATAIQDGKPQIRQSRAQRVTFRQDRKQGVGCAASALGNHMGQSPGCNGILPKNGPLAGDAGPSHPSARGHMQHTLRSGQTAFVGRPGVTNFKEFAGRCAPRPPLSNAKGHIDTPALISVGGRRQAHLPRACPKL